MGDGKGFDLSRLGVWSDEATFHVGRDRTVAYAKATNDPVKQHLEGLVAPPVFAVVPVMDMLAAATMSVVPDDLMLRILHGEQDLRFHRAIEPGETLTARAKPIGVSGRSSGVVVTTYIETRDTRGEIVNEQYFAGFFRGGAFEGTRGRSGPTHAFDESLRGRGADATVVQRFDPDQTFRYAEAAGDPMPIHLDDDFAKQMGLPGIIVHGLCTNAFVSHALINHACPEDPARLKRLAVRFSKPARPGQRVTTCIWEAGTADHAKHYAFETLNDEGEAVIKDGLAEVTA